MSQTIYLPMDEVTVNVGYKSEKYRKEYSCVQYGTDLAGSARMVHASATGTIETIGTDSDGTIFVVVRYEDVKCYDGKVRTVWVKYGHLIRCQLDPGYEVEDGELLGSYEGGYLHVEMALEYDPELNPVFNSSKRTYDNTVAPYLVWKAREKDDPDNGLYKQTIATNDAWLKAGWVNLVDILDFSEYDGEEIPEEKPTEEPDDEEEQPSEKPDTPDEPSTPSDPSDWEMKFKSLTYDLCALIKKYNKD